MDALSRYLVRLKPKKTTWYVYKNVLTKFFNEINRKPDDFLKLAKENPHEAKFIVEAYLAEMLADEKAPNYVLLVKRIIQGFLQYYEINIRIDVNLRGSNKNLDYIPSKEEVFYLISRAKNRTKAAIALMAFAGMRPIDVVNLRFVNVKEDIVYDEDLKIYKAKRVPMKITIRQRKTGQWYVTFLGPRGAEILCNYLTELSRKLGRPLKDFDKLFSWTSPLALEHEVRWLIEQHGLRYVGPRRFRPYSFRKYFRRAIIKLGEDVAEYLMGHVKGINSLSAVYSGLRDLDNRAIEELRKQYAKIVPELEGSTVEPIVSEELEKLKRRVKFLEDVLGVLTKLHPEDLEKVIRYAKLLQAKREYEEILEETNEEIEELAMMTSQLS